MANSCSWDRILFYGIETAVHPTEVELLAAWRFLWCLTGLDRHGGEQRLLLPVVVVENLLTSSFARAMSYLRDHELVYKPLDTNFTNGEVGVSA